MSRKWILLLGVFLIFSVSAAARADEKAPPPDKAETKIVVNQDDGTINFIIKGQTKAVLDEDGLHVRDNIEYGGTIADIGTVNFDAMMKDEAKAKDTDGVDHGK